MFSRHHPYGGSVIVVQGMRPHWVRLVVLLLLVVAVIYLPAIGERPRVSVPQQASSPLAGSFQPSASDAELLAAIERANRAFRAAHQHANPAALDGVATGAWLDEERLILADLRDRGIVEHWTPRSFTLISRVVEGTTATVCTDETWELVTADASGRRGPAETRHHIEQYSLQRVGEAWLVSAIEYDTKRCGV